MRHTGGGKFTYDKHFYSEKAHGKRLKEIYGFPFTIGAWCHHLKDGVITTYIRKGDIREIVLPHSESAQAERERERDGWQRHGAGCGANSQLKMAALRQINPRFPHPKGNLVQQRTQKSSPTDFQSQSTKGIGVHNSKSGFSETALAQGGKKNIVQYLGIAADEPKRIERHTKKGIILPLVDIGWDEAYCRQWCEKHNLLSPIYTTATRGGCWFCHNQGVDQLRQLRKDYPNLWQLLLKWDNDSPTTFKADGHTVHDFDKRFQAEDNGLIKAGDRRFRWKTVLEPKNEELR